MDFEELLFVFIAFALGCFAGVVIMSCLSINKDEK